MNKKEKNYNEADNNKTNTTLNELGTQTDENPVDCQKCQDVQAKQLKLINELTKNCRGF